MNKANESLKVTKFVYKQTPPSVPDPNIDALLVLYSNSPRFSKTTTKIWKTDGMNSGVERGSAEPNCELEKATSSSTDKISVCNQ